MSSSSPSRSWGERLIARLASTPAIVVDSSGGDDDGGGGGEVVWRRADQLSDVDEIRVGGGGERRGDGGDGRRCDDGMRRTPTFEFPPRNDPPPRGAVRPGSSTPAPSAARSRRGRRAVVDELSRRTIRDPLRSLPARFLGHFLNEVAHRFVPARRDESPDVLAPTTLVAIVAALGLAFVGIGLTGLGVMLVNASARAIGSLCAWMLGCSLSMSNKLAWISIGLVAAAWIRASTTIGEPGANVKATASLAFFPVPSASVVLPWTVAIASTSFCEALIVVLSLLAFSSVLVPGNNARECSPVHAIDAGQYCSDDAESHEPAPYQDVAVATVALLVAATNVLVVAVAANKLERYRIQSEMSDDAGKSDSSGNSSPVELDETSSASSSAFDADSARSRLRTTYGCIRQHVCACHTISILALSTMSMSLILVQALYAYFRKEGMNVIFAMGTVARHIVYIGLGIVILVLLWNSTFAAVAGNGRIPCGEISRCALKKSIMEISSQAVWSTEDTGSSLLGILSNDDGALRYAILEWIVDCWTASPMPTEQAAPSERTASQFGDDSLPPAAMGDKEEESKIKPTTNSCQDGNHLSLDPNPTQGRTAKNSGNTTTNSSTADDLQTSIPSYQSPHRVIAKLDADETLIPTIERYREWVYSLPPSRNAAMCVALWKMCPAITVFAATVLWCVGWSVIESFFVCFMRCVRVSSQIASASNGNGCTILCFILTVLSPVMLLEYHRVQIWWTKTVRCIRSIKYDVTSSDSQIMQRDLAMNLLRADLEDYASQRVVIANFPVDTSYILLRIWLLLIESVSLLEASIPVVRCATVTCAAADLTTNTISLVDLALEVKKRGLLGGVGMIAWDAFCYYLSIELEERKREADDTRSTDQAREEQSDDGEELGGQYTGAAVNAVANFGKLSHNLSCLMEKKKSEHGDERKSDGGDDGNKNNEPTKWLGVVETSNHGVSSEKCTQDDRKSEVPSLGEHNQDDPTSLKQDENFHENCGDHQNENGGLPFLIGGGIALVGAVAGLALHAATSRGKQVGKDPKKDTS
ncbi:hypothetical protein ACHAW5_005310 [Stephanodiscus triporus]|uniref:Solute carrier family 40 protein n=1 Tax=Stephanodiscus triporus TaxID=2934178 RepID=A0ABD3ND27_9STRA